MPFYLSHADTHGNNGDEVGTQRASRHCHLNGILFDPTGELRGEVRCLDDCCSPRGHTEIYTIEYVVVDHISASLAILKSCMPAAS